MRFIPLALVVAMICSEAALPHRSFRRAWPLRAILSSPSKKPVGFRAITLGGELIVQKGNTPIALSSTDTLHSITPANFPLDLRGGAVRFLADGRDSLELVVGQNPGGSVHPVRAKGRGFTVRLVADTVVIDRR